MSIDECKCLSVNASSDGHDDRVGLIADVASNCGCEKYRMSEYSPGPVADAETIVRMVCVPMHVHRKKPELLPNFFSHAFSKGMSAQRLDSATDFELADWVNQFLGGGADRVWLGFVHAPCSDIRRAQTDTTNGSRLFCVYDAALKENPAHVEVASAGRIPEADVLEARAALRRSFMDGKVYSRDSLRSGGVVAKVREDLLAREWPTQWTALLAPPIGG